MWTSPTRAGGAASTDQRRERPPAPRRFLQVAENCLKNAVASARRRTSGWACATAELDGRRGRRTRVHVWRGRPDAPRHLARDRRGRQGLPLLPDRSGRQFADSKVIFDEMVRSFRSSSEPARQTAVRPTADDLALRSAAGRARRAINSSSPRDRRGAACLTDARRTAGAGGALAGRRPRPGDRAELRAVLDGLPGTAADLADRFAGPLHVRHRGAARSAAGGPERHEPRRGPAGGGGPGALAGRRRVPGAGGDRVRRAARVPRVRRGDRPGRHRRRPRRRWCCRGCCPPRCSRTRSGRSAPAPA